MLSYGMKMGFWNWIISGSLNYSFADIATPKSSGHAGESSVVRLTFSPFVVSSSSEYDL